MTIRVKDGYERSRRSSKATVGRGGLGSRLGAAAAAARSTVTPGASLASPLARKSSGSSQPEEPTRGGACSVTGAPRSVMRDWFWVKLAERGPTVSVPREPLTLQDPLM